MKKIGGKKEKRAETFLRERNDKKGLIKPKTCGFFFAKTNKIANPQEH